MLLRDEVGEGGVGGGEEVLGCQAELEPTLACAAIDVVVAGEGLMHPCGQGFFHADRGASAADITGEGQQLADVDHLDFFVTGDLGCFLEVHFVRSGDDADKEAGLVASEYECLEDLFDGKAQYFGRMLCSQVLLVHLVGDEFVANMELVE